MLGNTIQHSDLNIPIASVSDADVLIDTETTHTTNGGSVKDTVVSSEVSYQTYSSLIVFSR
jgi:hypothetical protein